MIETLHLFPILNRELVALLRSLTGEEWNAQTIAKKWKVKDIAAHLLDTNMRAISTSRDKHLAPPDQAINSYSDLLDFLNRLNADWVNAYKRVSPALLVDQLVVTNDEYVEQLRLLDPQANAIFSVAWAGESVSKNWFHVAREYTEKWHHQQQIREAVGKPGIMTRELFYPMIDTFMQGLPYTYRDTTASEGTIVEVIIDTEIGGKWQLTKKEGQWYLSQHKDPVAANASITLQPDLAWKLFTKGVRPDDVKDQIVIRGDETLARVALNLVAVMA